MPTKTLTLTFTPEKADYTRTIRAYQMRDRRIAIAFGLLALEILCFSGLYIAGLLGDNPLILLAVAPLPLAALYLFIVMPWMVGKRVASSAGLLSEVVWRATEEGISIRSGRGKKQLQWSEFSSLLPTREHLLLFYKGNRRTFQFVPRRAFTSPEQQAAFIELARQGITGQSSSKPSEEPAQTPEPPSDSSPESA